MRNTRLLYLLLPAAIAAGCNNNSESKKEEVKDSTTAVAPKRNNYAQDADYLVRHSRTVLELADDENKAKVLLSADYQGRVMTSTATGDSGTSYGWLNYDLIAAPAKKAQFNPVGGEERFWLGPEGGQYSIYFKGNDSFAIKNWQVPAVIDTLPYDIVQSDRTRALFTKKATLTNYSGTVFDIGINREIRLLPKSDIERQLQSSIPAGINIVGYQTNNEVTNMGKTDWSREKGLLSIWLLGMFTPTPQTVVIIPFHPQPGARQLITDNYFGAIPAGRLTVMDSVLVFTCDGKHRSKIGLSPLIAKPMAGSFDFANNVLTLVIPSIEHDGMYVNSKWEIQQEPYKGDVINSYNDGPLADGSQLGPFYEIESSSPARELKKGDKLSYSQVTCHLQGDYNALRDIARKILNVDLNSLRK